MTETTVEKDYTLYVRQYEQQDPRLGRNVLHDSRSLAYAAPEQDPTKLSSIRHQRYVPIFDQGNTGSCTGNASTGCLGTGVFYDTAGKNVLTKDASVDETYAVGVYSDATKLDPFPGTYPPTDTGSDGLSVAKVLKARGLISGYTHALSLEAALTALAKQPVIVGTEWDQDQFNPDSDGRLHPTGAVAGGHEYLLTQLDVENRRVWIDNSWGTSWGIEGRAYYTWDDFGELLSRDGDVTIFTPNTQPAPTPTPTPPAPTPTPAPSDPTELFIQQAEYWVSLRHSSRVNTTFEKQITAWLASLGK